MAAACEHVHCVGCGNALTDAELAAIETRRLARNVALRSGVVVQAHPAWVFIAPQCVSTVACAARESVDAENVIPDMSFLLAKCADACTKGGARGCHILGSKLVELEAFLDKNAPIVLTSAEELGDLAPDVDDDDGARASDEEAEGPSPCKMEGVIDVHPGDTLLIMRGPAAASDAPPRPDVPSSPAKKARTG